MGSGAGWVGASRLGGGPREQPSHGLSLLTLPLAVTPQIPPPPPQKKTKTGFGGAIYIHAGRMKAPFVFFDRWWFGNTLLARQCSFKSGWRALRGGMEAEGWRSSEDPNALPPPPRPALHPLTTPPPPVRRPCADASASPSPDSVPAPKLPPPPRRQHRVGGRRDLRPQDHVRGAAGPGLWGVWGLRCMPGARGGAAAAPAGSRSLWAAPPPAPAPSAISIEPSHNPSPHAPPPRFKPVSIWLQRATSFTSNGGGLCTALGSVRSDDWDVPWGGDNLPGFPLVVTLATGGAAVFTGGARHRVLRTGLAALLAQPRGPPHAALLCLYTRPFHKLHPLFHTACRQRPLRDVRLDGIRHWPPPPLPFHPAPRHPGPYRAGCRPQCGVPQP
jgi:hypothetical protein